MNARLVAALLLVCLLQGPRESGATENTMTAGPARIFDLPYTLHELDNGLRVLIVPTDFPDAVSLQIPVQTGSRNEVEPGKTGFAHFFEHMMFRGTERYPPERYSEILKRAGADQNAYTTDDYTNYHVTFTKADLELMLELEADRFQNLRYDEEQFRTEALAVKGEYLKNYSNPLQKLFEVLLDRSFTTHTYKHTTMGFFADIEAMPEQIEYSRAFFDRWYRPEKSTLILVGDLEPDPTLRLVEKYWGAWQRRDYEVQIPAEPPPAGPYRAHVAWEAPTQPWLVFAWRGPPFEASGREMPAADIVAELYLSESSRLYQRLVTEERLVDQLFPYFPNRKDPNLLVIAARLLEPGHAPRVRDAVYETLTEIRTTPVAPAQLEATKSRLRYAFASQLTDTASIAAMLAAFMQFERDPETINRLYASYAAVEPADLIAFAERYFNDAGMTVVTLAHGGELPGVAELPSLDQRVAKARQRTAPSIPVVAQPSQTSPLVDVSLVFSTGALDDPPGKRGLAALTASLLADGGSERLTIGEIRNRMYPLASGLSSQVDKEMTRFTGTVHRDNLDAWYALASDQLLSPGWRAEDFERIREQQINAIRTDLVGNNDEELAKELLYEFVYGPLHPYGHLTLGAVDELQRIELADVQSFYRGHYAANLLTIGLAGDYPQAFRERLVADLSRLPAVDVERGELPPPPPITANAALIAEKETPAVAVSFGFPLDVRRGDADWVALWLAVSWLGEHRSSLGRLYQRLRELRGLNYGDYAYLEYFPRGMFQFKVDANLARRQQIFQIWLRPLRDNNDAMFATRAALHELERLVSQGMAADAFEATRAYLHKSVSLGLASQFQRLGYAIDSRYYRIDQFDDYVRAGLARLTLEDVNAALRRHLRADRIKFVFVTREAADLAERLRADTPSPISYNASKPESLLGEDRIIAARPLALRDVRVVGAERVFSGRSVGED